jgi:DNA polymerase III alpha subunit (gram-positive type)
MDKIAKYIAFDSESTGLDSNINNILTISFIILDKNLNEIDRLNLSIKHNIYNVTIKALEVNKINLIKHHNESIDIITATNTLINFLKKNKNSYHLIPICHNCTHDISFIQNSGLLSKEQYNNYFSYNNIDTIVIAQYLKMCGKLPDKQSISLSSLSEYYGITNNSKLQHTCEYDTEMTIQLLKRFRDLEKIQVDSNLKKRKLM